MTELNDASPPEWRLDGWLNTPAPLALSDFRERVLVVLAFQMLCPGCVSDAIPQLKRVQQTFATADLAVVGMHTVFEHHGAMGREALEAFAHEYRLTFPVAIDLGGAEDGIPQTMRAYQMEGTPTLLIYDRKGTLVRKIFGHIPDMALGALLASLLSQA